MKFGRLPRTARIALIAVPVILVLALGVSGYRSMGADWSDSTYFTLLLFLGNYASVGDEPTSIALAVARILALVFTAYAVIALSWLVLNRVLTDLRLTLLRPSGHVVVIGETSLAMHIAEWEARDSTVVLVRSHAGADLGNSSPRGKRRGKGQLITLPIDGKLDEAGFDTARLSYAMRTYVCGPNWTENLSTAVWIDDTARARDERAAPLLLVEVSTLEDYDSIRDSALYSLHGESPSRIEPFLPIHGLIDSITTRLTLLRTVEGQQLAHVCVIGDGDWADLISAQLTPRLASTMVHARSTETDSCPEATALVLDGASDAAVRRVLRGTHGPSPSATVVIVGPHALAPLAARMNAILIDPAEVVRESGLRASTVERLAQTIHANYTKKHAQSEIGGKQWSDLSDAERGDNFAQAEGLMRILDEHGFQVLRGAPNEPLITFTPDEETELSIAEHDRWVDRKVADGWTFGETTNRAARVHSSLVPWDLLPANEQGKDREQVVEWPELLRMVDYRIERRVRDAAPADVLSQG